jgi:hypothetical protein
VTAGAILLATARFTAFEGAVFATGVRLTRGFGADRWLALLAIDITIEASMAGALSFAHLNSQAAYWALALALAIYGRVPDLKWPRWGWTAAAIAALAVPLLLVGFRPVEEIDSVNYLHYLIDWMANRATPYSFATYYVAFCELSFVPTWMVTGVDLFFPIVALKGVAVLAAAAWLVGRELEVERRTLAWTVFGAVTMRHYWLEHSGVATLKNDALHGAGFLILMVVVLRAARRPIGMPEVALTGLGMAFAAVKYSGIFTGGIAVAAIVWLARDRRLLWAVPIFLLTSGHYYVRTLTQFGNPFYPFQINLGPLHLRGDADLSFTSILYHARDPRVWRYLLWPEGGVSPAGVLFPAILAGAVLGSAGWLLRSAFRRREHERAVTWAALLILTGWMLYFRSVYSASAGHDDLAFLGNGLNSLRYVDGLLAASEIWLAALLGRLALPLVAIDTASRLLLVYARLPFPVWIVLAAMLAIVLLRRWAPIVVAAALLLGGPVVVERNRARWTTYWDDLKPSLGAVRGPELAAFAMEEGSFFAGHVVAAGNPVHPEVRALLPEELDALAPAARPRYLAVLVTPGSDWRPHYAAKLSDWGYQARVERQYGALLERNPR